MTVSQDTTMNDKNVVEIVTPTEEMVIQAAPSASATGKPKQKQMSLEFFSFRRKKESNDTGDDAEKVVKKQKIEETIVIDANDDPMKTEEVVESHEVIKLDDYADEELETEENVDDEIMALATETDNEEDKAENNDIANVSVLPDTTMDSINISMDNSINVSMDNFTATTTQTKSDARSIKREQEREQKKALKLAEEEKKREAKRLKKLEEETRRREKKVKEDEERRLKREKIESEREAKRQQKDAEKAEKQQKKEEELKLKEEKKKKEEEEKLKKKEELEKKKEEKLLEKQKIEEEKEQKRLEEETKKQKRSIMNFFKVKPTASTRSPVTVKSDVQSDSTPISESNSEQSTTQSEKDNEFLQYFLPFHVKPNVKLAKNVNDQISSKWDDFIKSPSSFKPETEQPVSTPIVDAKPERAFTVLQCLNSGSMNEANRLFQSVPLRYLKFYENKRTAYLGTFSYTLSDVKEDVNLKLHSFTKVSIDRIGSIETEAEQPGPVIDYEYDSDIDAGDEDGEDDEEGEDLGSADEEDDDDEEMGSSDIDEFVETDANDGTASGEGEGNKKRRVMGPLVPVIRNCKEDIVEGDEFGEYFTTLQWERMNENIQFPIDPYKDYWGSNRKSEKKESNSAQTQQGRGIFSTQPLPNTSTSIDASKSTNGALDNITNTTVSAAPMAVKKKVISNVEHLKVLLEFVENHKQLSLNTLAELAVKDVSHKVLGEYSRAVVKNSVKANASFDKKTGWVVKKLDVEEVSPEVVKMLDLKHDAGEGEVPPALSAN